MSLSDELLGMLDVEAAEFGESTTARMEMGIAVRRGEQGGIVWVHDQQRQSILDSLLGSGAEPIGIVTVTDDGGKITAYTKLFNKYADDISANTSIKKICRSIRSDLIKRIQRIGRVKNVSYFEDPSGWLQ